MSSKEDLARVSKPKSLGDRKQAWSRLKQIMDRVGKRHHKIPEKEAEEDVLEAIRTVRSQMIC